MTPVITEVTCNKVSGGAAFILALYPDVGAAICTFSGSQESKLPRNSRLEIVISKCESPCCRKANGSRMQNSPQLAMRLLRTTIRYNSQSGLEEDVLVSNSCCARSYVC